MLLWIGGTDVTYKEDHEGGSHIVLFWMEGTDVTYRQNHDGRFHIV